MECPLSVPVVAERSKEPARGAAVVPDRDIDLDQPNCAQGTLEARDRPLVALGRIVVDEHMSLPRKGILHNGQLRFGHGREKEFDDVRAFGKVIAASRIRVQRSGFRVVRIAIDLPDAERSAVVQVGARPRVRKIVLEGAERVARSIEFMSEPVDEFAAVGASGQSAATSVFQSIHGMPYHFRTLLSST